MRAHLSLASLLDQQAFIFTTQLNDVYEGGVDGIHDARVATRRIRELLALVPVVPGRERKDGASHAYKKIGRALGRVRDIDVQLALIRNLEDHAPQAAPSLVIVRQDHERDRLVRTRKLIKTLERTDVPVLLNALSEVDPMALRRRLTASGWRQQLERLMIERSRDAVAAIEHATGVYFPRRAHAARIAIKKLRYAAEIAEAIGFNTVQPATKVLRKGQEILGELHDRQALADTLRGYADHEGVVAAHVELTREVLEREVMRLHCEYLERRAALRDACAGIQNSASRAWGPRSAILVGSALAVSGMVYRQLRAGRPQPAR